MKDYTLILDLDDTIFRTRSMHKEWFDPFFDRLVLNLMPRFSEEAIHAITEDLWSKTWDKVLSDHQVPRGLLLDAIKVLDKLEPDLKISTYPDYSFIKDLGCPKFLVTTSIESIQKKKIAALGIEKDFEKIVIVDPLAESRTKQDVFKELQQEFDLDPKSTYVIGDNPDSEIEAGNALNMITVQILREGVRRGTNARHYIQSFHELAPFLLSKI